MWHKIDISKAVTGSRFKIIRKVVFKKKNEFEILTKIYY